MPEIMQVVPILFVGFAASLVLTPLSRQLALRLGVIDQPSQRKLHLDSKPMMGGLAIYVALALTLLLFSPARHIAALAAVLAGAALLALLGLLDDRYDLSWRRKAPVMLLAAAGMAATGVKVTLSGSDWIDVPLTVIWIFVITNAVNYLDNMDGQSAGTTSIAAFFFPRDRLESGPQSGQPAGSGRTGQRPGISWSTTSIHPAALWATWGRCRSASFWPSWPSSCSSTRRFPCAGLSPCSSWPCRYLTSTWSPGRDILEGRSPAEAGRDHTSHRLLATGRGQRRNACAAAGLLHALRPAGATDQRGLARHAAAAGGARCVVAHTCGASDGAHAATSAPG